MQKRIGLVRVIRDPRDATRDYFIPAERARVLYNAGELVYNVTNECYQTKELRGL
jgi:hypothetical protein